MHYLNNKVITVEVHNIGKAGPLVFPKEKEFEAFQNTVVNGNIYPSCTMKGPVRNYQESYIQQEDEMVYENVNPNHNSSLNHRYDSWMMPIAEETTFNNNQMWYQPQVAETPSQGNYLNSEECFIPTSCQMFEGYPGIVDTTGNCIQYYDNEQTEEPVQSLVKGKRRFKIFYKHLKRAHVQQRMNSVTQDTNNYEYRTEGKRAQAFRISVY